jgi:dolichol-phosphate mannosyltransferase
MAPEYSLVIPIYNEADVLPELYKRIQAVIKCLDGPAELLLVDDGSQDDSLVQIRELHQQDSCVCYLSLGRNFGHQIAVTAGLDFASGNAVIVLDADLQDPPELIPKMADLWRAGYQVVYAQRTKRRQEDLFKRTTAFWFYRLLNRLADVEIPKDTGDFCLMDRQVVDVLKTLPECHRYIRGLRAWVGFRQTAVKFERDPRLAGEVKYTFRKSLGLAINSIISFSRVPLRVATYLGLLTASLALLMILLVIYWRLVQPSSPLIGYTIIAVAIFFLVAVQLICLGILGEYIGRIYEEVKRRPLYTLREVAGLTSVPHQETP